MWSLYDHNNRKSVRRYFNDGVEWPPETVWTIQIIQIQLKQPKMARTNPVHIVELSETSGLLFPVKAFLIWRKNRK